MSNSFVTPGSQAVNLEAAGSVAIAGGNFGYTRQNIDDLSGSRITLADIVADESPSVTSFIRDIEGAVRDSVLALQKSAFAAQIMAKTIAFERDTREVHGYLELPLINAQQYLNTFRPHGGTDIENAALHSLSTMVHYASDLFDQDFLVNGVMILITDGESFSKHRGPVVIAEQKRAILAKDPAVLESLTTILVGVNVGSGGLSTYLNDFKVHGEFDHYVGLPDASPATIAKLVGIISKSVSSSSASLGSGTAPSLSF